MSEQVCVSTTHEVREDLKRLRISPSECFRVGYGVMKADREQLEPETVQQLKNKVSILSDKLQKLAKENFELKEKYEKKQTGIEEPTTLEGAPLEKEQGQGV